ncbi:DUF4123 domain-containing protein [Cupriavidus basilensis]|uniref:DUF4123 domain-containing protein n=1 Tax=Cupriavidus basilensis TaxID=68895 RepID=A0ABT6AZY2_9BURK|nr:DUF4123 domain-containing protein [Cupriavidus basilensis]MDF3837281.1 DUF4123 domain-containing protein [Cupriavidus basilensis]
MTLIDLPTDTARQRLYTHVAAACSKLSLSRVHALLDLSFADDARRQALAQLAPEPSTLYRDLYAGEGLDSIDPWLIEVPLEPADRFLALCEHCAGQPMLSFLVSPASHGDLLTHLRGQLEAKDDAGDTFILRWADTRCLPSMYAILDETQRTRLCSGISAWWYMSRDGEPASLEMPSAAAPSRHDTAFPYQLTATQIQAVRTSARPDWWLAYIADRPHLYGALTGNASRHHAVTYAAIGSVPNDATDAHVLRSVVQSLADQGLLQP